MGMRAILAAVLLALPGAAPAQEDMTEALQAYVDFATYEQGIILPQQIDRTVFDSATFIDVRDAGQAAEGGIPGAVHIEWRDLPYRMDEVPQDGMVVFYCNTGTLSSQAMLMARLMGRDNALVLQSGYTGWQDAAAYRP